MHEVLEQLCAGSVAGFTATGPMTLVMDALYRPEVEHEPIAPRVVTERALETVGLRDELSESQRQDATMLAHFSYGATVGAAYPLLARQFPLPPALGGAAYGLAVWAAGYCGWLPATGLYRPPQRESARRNFRLIAAHLVWGATLGLMTHVLSREREHR